MALYSYNQRLRQPQSDASLRDWVKITKPGIVISNTLMAAVGVVAAMPDAPALLHAAVAIGTAGLIAGCGALNMVLERQTDGRMPRTARRPIADGRIGPEGATVFGISLIAGGSILLSSTTLAAVLLGLLATFVYLALYTPMKRSTWWAVPVGAVAGAMPPLIGWVATNEALGLVPALLTAILFVWQLPHFIAIGIRRWRDYERAGLRIGVRPNVQRAGVRGARMTTLGLLILTGALGVAIDAGMVFWLAAMIGSCGLFVSTLHRMADPTDWAKRVFLASLFYLPLFALGVCWG